MEQKLIDDIEIYDRAEPSKALSWWHILFFGLIGGYFIGHLIVFILMK